MHAIFLFFTGLGYIHLVTSTRIQEPRECYNRFEYEYRVLEQLIELKKGLELERDIKTKLIQEVKDAQKIIEAMKTQLTGVHKGLEGSTYTRWGRTVCPEGATLVYKGSVGKGHYKHSGSGTNYLCLPNDPKWGEYMDGFQTSDRIYGTEYYTKDFNAWKHVHAHDAPCAVCRIPRNDVLMIPGRNQCYGNYKLEYSGYLMAEYYAHSGSSNYVCVDHQPETIPAGHEYKAESFLMFVEASCGVLKCPPYASGQELTCAVCSFSPNTTE